MSYRLTMPSKNIMSASGDDHGHGNYCDVLTLKNGAVVVIGAEGISLYKSEESFNNGDGVGNGKDGYIDSIRFTDDMGVL